MKLPSLALLCFFNFSRAAGHCTPELLRADNSGQYFRLVKDEEETTCSKLTDGACPLAVPAPGYPCLVSCVSSEEECARLNPQAPSVNPLKDDKLCTSCPITACKTCHYQDDSVGCKACFETRQELAGCLHAALGGVAMRCGPQP
ncbi:unnamed protein product [Symbiodinium natans]|uniref:Uncharacterized protein n=1 Tax=Symbiodinium natans TaxID=878477 RepID=A0A812LTT4_9DINO|nr:unnamed protein product [Symbiodinium natans]